MDFDFKPTRTLIQERIDALQAKEKLAEETISALSDLIDNTKYEIPAWVRTCLRGVRQSVATLIDS